MAVKERESATCLDPLVLVVRRIRSGLGSKGYREAGPASPVSTFLARMIDLHRRTRAIRCDNGAEPTRQTFTSLCKEHHIELGFILPGNPDQNTQIAHFNRTCRE